MITYNLQVPNFGAININTVERRADDEDDMFIPLSMDNRHCRQFIRDWKNGAVVLQIDGVTPYPYSLVSLGTLNLTEVEN